MYYVGEGKGEGEEEILYLVYYFCIFEFIYGGVFEGCSG